MLVIIRPGTDVFQWASLYMLGSAICYALYQILTRRVAGYDSAETTAVYSALVGTVVMSIVAPFVWTPIASWTDAGLLFSLGIIGGTAHYFVARAMTYAEASIIAPFGYWQLVGSVVVGYVISGYLPDSFTWIGAGIIMCAGSYIAWHETRSRPAVSAQRAVDQRGASTGRGCRAIGRPGRDFDDELLQHRFGEGLVGLDRDHERVGAADHIGPVVLVEKWLHREDRQAVDDDTGPHGLVARVGRCAAAIVGAVARNVDDAPHALVFALGRTASWRGRWRR